MRETNNPIPVQTRITLGYKEIMDNTTTLSGFSFFDGLQLLFIGLKLTGAVTWSWWLVASPFLTLLALGFLSPLVFHLVQLARRS